MFRTVLRLTEEKLGAAGMERAIHIMPGDLAEAVRYGRIMPSGWYSVRWFRALLGAVGGASGLPGQFVRNLGREGLRLEYNTVYRALMRLLSAQSLLATGMAHFGQVYSVGKVDPLDFRKNYARVYIYECTDFDRHVWEYLVGACMGMVELAGGTSVHARILRGGDGEDCEAEATWK